MVVLLPSRAWKQTKVTIGTQAGGFGILGASSQLLGSTGEEKQRPLHPSEFLAETPVIKDRLTREKHTKVC